MDSKESIKAEIETEIEKMGAVDELCARVVVNLAQTISLLLTNRDDARLGELKRISLELFDEAERARDEHPVTMQ